MKLYALSEESLNAVLTYLGTRPLAEVAQLYNQVRTAKLITNADGTPFSPSNEAPTQETTQEPPTESEMPLESSQAV